MRVDVGNALEEIARPGVPEEALERLDRRVGRAHTRIEAGRTAGTHGYTALNLPETTSSDRIESAINRVPDATDVILVGIGGSALGAATVAMALDSDVRLHVLDHLDPVALTRTLERVDLSSTVVHIVSRSGTTTETVANAMIVKDAMNTTGLDWSDRTLVTTGQEGPLRDLVETHDLPALTPPEGVPGRYSVLSTMGLPALALCGHDIGALLEGGRRAIDTLDPSLFESPAYAYGAISYALAVRGATVNAMMPYAEGLETFAEWFAQLWAESLGKDGVGQVPVRALGVTDQHSQLQLYRSGPSSVQVSFLRVTDRRTNVSVPSEPISDAAGVGGVTLSEIVDAEFKATEASLAAAGRPTVRIDLPRIDERSLGSLLVNMEAACMMAAELFGVNAFDQPAVEWGKRATRGVLADEETEETRAIAEKRRLEIP